jgi:hypothetical protein
MTTGMFWRLMMDLNLILYDLEEGERDVHPILLRLKKRSQR